MVGQAPECEPFHEMFDWPDAVVPLRLDGSDVADVLGGLAHDPERLRELSRQNARQALLRHDWTHRWRRVLEIAPNRDDIRANYVICLLKMGQLETARAEAARGISRGGSTGAFRVLLANAYQRIARARHSVPGVTLISPPPHHDI